MISAGPNAKYLTGSFPSGHAFLTGIMPFLPVRAVDINVGRFAQWDGRERMAEGKFVSYVDDNGGSGPGGSNLSIGGTLSNNNLVQNGAGSLVAATNVSAAALSNASNGRNGRGAQGRRSCGLRTGPPSSACVPKPFRADLFGPHTRVSDASDTTSIIDGAQQH
jgi:hypothetical protein